MAGEKKWFVQKASKVFGPFTSRQLQELAQTSKITPETLVRIGSDGAWSQAGRVKGLFFTQNQTLSASSEESGRSSPSQGSPAQLFVRRNGQVVGPMSLDKIKALVKANKLSSSDSVSTSRNGPWKNLTSNLLKAIGDVLAKQEEVYDDPVVVEAEADDGEDAWLKDQDSFDSIVRESKQARSVALPSPVEDDEDVVDEEEDWEPAPRKSSRGKSLKKKKSKKSKSRGRGELAHPLQRLLAVLMDGVFGLLAFLPFILMLVLSVDWNNPDQAQLPQWVPPFLFLLLFAGALALGVTNLFMLIMRSQTLGKWFCNIQIVDVETDEPAGFIKGWLLRTFVNNMIGGIPFIGPIYSIADICFIFAEDRRCLHDHIAGTQVVDIS